MDGSRDSGPAEYRKVVRSIELMASADSAEELAEFVHDDALNREAVAEPPQARGRGPAAFFATARWLRQAYSDLRWEIHEVVGTGDLVAVHTTMHGRQTGPFVVYDERGEIDQVFPPTGRSFASTQTHWFRLREGKVIEHWANRDDLGQARQVGWVPPSPLLVLRGALLKRRMRRAAP